jgi:nucleoid-associated protein YgaU
MPASIYSRYYELDTVEVDGRVGFVQRLTGAPATYPDGLVHTIVGGETLEQLAARYYGRAELWWRIADANPGRFPLDWGPGDTLFIPPIRVATRMPRR